MLPTAPGTLVISRSLLLEYSQSNLKWKSDISLFMYNETAEKEVQDTSCRGSGGVPQLWKSPKIGGLGG